MSRYDIESKTFYDIKCQTCDFKLEDINSNLEAINEATKHLEEYTDEEPSKNWSHIVEVKEKILIGRNL